MGKECKKRTISDRALRSSALPPPETPKEVDNDDKAVEASTPTHVAPLKKTKPCGGMPGIFLPCGEENEKLPYVYPRKMGAKYFCSVDCLDAFRSLVSNLDSDQSYLKKINELEQSLRLHKIQANIKIAEKDQKIDDMAKRSLEMEKEYADLTKRSLEMEKEYVDLAQKFFQNSNKIKQREEEQTKIHEV